MRLAPLVLLFGLLSRCGGGAVVTSSSQSIAPVRTAPPAHIVLERGETRTFPPGALRPGDVVTCELSGHHLRLRVPNRPGGGWAMGTGAATPSGGTGALQLKSSPDGSVTASCGSKTS